MDETGGMSKRKVSHQEKERRAREVRGNFLNSFFVQKNMRVGLSTCKKKLIPKKLKIRIHKVKKLVFNVDSTEAKSGKPLEGVLREKGGGRREVKHNQCELPLTPSFLFLPPPPPSPFY
jgi:hypothetical protein